ncbi:MAG: PilN domain-containing protein [Pseudomonadota bacterium]|nr:PilN domain-containing protein [Pseudomonadota bacterium]MDP1904284.1 PilN domain-containing protein [Pseudomonadota bacterium]MDP2351854.1 PilN domain-containing protein [Pseudomonadota bacterium]
MTAIRINLLPHRQLRRAYQQRLFALLAVVVAGIGLAAVVAGQVQLSNAKSAQDRRNAFLGEEIGKLDKQITEIKQLRDKTQDLLSRKNVVEALQGNRTESVRLFDELARRMPDGLYLKSVKQTGDNLELSGYAQSSARVSTYMRALDETSLFQDPSLVEVKAAQVGNLRVNEFSMNVKISHQPLRGEKP